MTHLSRRYWLAQTGVAASTLLASCSTTTNIFKPSGAMIGSRLKEDAEAARQAPPIAREFRAAWIATVANIDWPSRKGLSTEQQQAEMRVILDRCVALRFNAVIFQVRTAADAFYASELEPWSEYLTGTQGKPPEPFYDPLAMWIQEAHTRGLELHAWFNPFRARQTDGKGAAPNHLSRSHPEWVKPYGKQLWIDPGERGAADHTLAVFTDVVRRYDIDGIHIDDYFYPYPVPNPSNPKLEQDFPDTPAWHRYSTNGGMLGRNDWRRNNVDTMVERLHREIHQIKPWVRFGISPFGIGRPELRPPGIQGLSQFHKLYANVERWLQQGWLDYLVPQLYWPINKREQAFATLLDYWHQQNPQKRHIWAGLYTSSVPNWPAQEIVSQITTVRQRAPGTGHVHFSMVALSQNRQGLFDALKSRVYTYPALVPATPWLEKDAPPPPQLEVVEENPNQLKIRLLPASGSKPVALWVLWLRYGNQWYAEIHRNSRLIVNLDQLTAVAAAAVDHVGNESSRVAWVVV
ncbi:MAG: hypothetical protein RIR79_631 [Pseudomonadota bacterium]|jgi:uncharacterized lipoprotein YddW (UPF0748 family)